MTKTLENYFARFNRLDREFKSLPVFVRDYLTAEGLQEPKEIVGGRYVGDFTEKDNREIEARWAKYNKVKAELETLCIKHDADLNKIEKAKRYAANALGL